MKVRHRFVACLLGLGAFVPRAAHADFFGGDVVVLSQILANAVQQLVQLRQLLSNGQDSLALMRDINKGLRDALALGELAGTKLPPGTLSDLDNIHAAMSKIEELYGLVPQTKEGPRQKMVDQSVAEAINLHNDVFDYAASVDPIAEQIKNHAQVVNPQGAQRLTAQSVGVLISVMNQLLRTNAEILKLQSQQLAAENRQSKLSSEQFVEQYRELSQSLGNFAPSYDLPKIR